MAGLSARMDAVAEIKKIQDCAIRRYRRITLAALFAGILVGGGVIALLLIHPVSAPEINKTILTAAAAFFNEWKEVLLAAAAIAAVVLGVIPWNRASSISR